MCQSHQKTYICVHNALVLIYYVLHTESTAGHICVQSDVDFPAKSNAVESIYVHVALVLIINVQYTESSAGNMCVKYEIVFSTQSNAE